MNPNTIKKALDKYKKSIEEEFGVIIVETEELYIAYESKIDLDNRHPLCMSNNLADLRNDLKLYLS